MRAGPTPAQAADWLGRPAGWAGGTLVAAVVAWLVHRVWDALFIPWWFNTDEVVFYYEVVRQLRLEFTQTFFDIPGTPYMTLTSLLTATWWAVERLLGMTTAATAGDFAFENIQGVYTLMRVVTLSGFAIAIGLTYDVFRRSFGALAAMAAAVLAASLPIHVHYSHFVRTESLGLVLSLLAIRIVLHGRQGPTTRAYLTAGALAGVAMAARFHFALVAPPVLAVIYGMRDRNAPIAMAAGRHWLHAAGACLAGVFVCGALVTLLHKGGIIGAGSLTNLLLLSTPAGPGEFAGAKQTVAKLWLLLGATSAAFLVAHAIPPARQRLRPLVNPLTLALLVGFAGGFLLSHPTFLWRGEHQLRSIQFYSDWVDPELAARGPLASWWNVTRYYLTTALPEVWLQLSFAAGVVAIGWKRRGDPASVAFLTGALVCFIAHPVTMKLWPHHIIPWLPFLCLVAAAMPAWAVGQLAKVRPHPAVTLAVLLAAGGALIWSRLPRFREARQYLETSRQRTEQITEMNTWLAANVSPKAFLAVSYFSLGESGFYKVMEGAGVRVPELVKRHREVLVWWLDRHSLDGREGYVCCSNADIHFFRQDFERKNPGSTYNPFEDKRFTPLATFGGGFYELKIFKFDFRNAGKP